MKSRTAQGMAAALATLAILAGTASQVSAAEAKQNLIEKSDPAAAPATYANYLRHSHEEGAADALKGFQQLTRVQQNKFVNYLHDPALFKGFLSQTEHQGGTITAFSGNTSRSTSLRQGDVTFESRRTISGAAASRPLPSGNHQAKYTKDLKILGVTVVHLSLWVNFHSNGHDITKANYADAAKTNVTGVVHLSKSTPKKALSDWSWCPIGGSCSHGHNASASVVWEGEIKYHGVGVQIDRVQSMTANIYGKVTGSLTSP